MLSIITSPLRADPGRKALLVSFFFVCLFVDTITLERLDQSEPISYTRHLTGIAHTSLKMGIAGHM